MRFCISVISATNWLIVWLQISKGTKQEVEQPDTFAAKFLAYIVQKELKRSQTSGKFVFSS
jgi:hypothetical protein